MIDIKLIRENTEEISQKIKDRGSNIDIDSILKLDKEVRYLSLSVQTLIEDRNKASK